MDTIRLILPQLLTYAIMVALLLIVVFFVKRETKDQEAIRVINKVCFYLLILIHISIAIWIVNLLSVNNVPRSTIDRSGMDAQKSALKSYTDSVNATKANNAATHQ